jgi:ubiquitin-conjugating enzyme E2 C
MNDVIMCLLQMSGEAGISAFPSGDNMFEWVGSIDGSKDTVYEGMAFKLKLVFPAQYPFKAPTVTFTTPIFHPNVDEAGNICLDILKEEWSAAYSVKTLLVSLQSLLGEPNNDSPLNSQAAGLWDNGAEYRRVCVSKYEEATGTKVAMA